MAWLILALLTVVVLGRFLDFLLGAKGQRAIKNRLVEWYVRVADGDWAGIVRYTAERTDQFISKALGVAIVSPRAIGVATLLSFVVTAVILVVAFAVEFGSLEAGIELLVGTNFVIAAAAILLANAIIDLPSLMITRRILRSIPSSRSDHSVAMFVMADIALCYVAVSLAVLLTVPTVTIGLTLGESALPNKFALWLKMLQSTDAFRHPWDSNMSVGDTNFSIFAVSAAFTTLMHILILSAAWLAKSTRVVTQKPIALFLQRFEEAPSGVFTTLAAAISLLAGLLAAYFNATGS